MQKLIGDEKTAENWAYKLSQDTNHWYVDGFDCFPSIIAHEYWRLRKLLEERKVYAACFQLRDVMESVLKYEVLAICAWANEKNVPGFQEQVGCQITTRSMSFGSWKALAEQIRWFFDPKKGVEPSLPAVFSDALKGIISQYGPFIQWRNEHIGHGALGFEENQDFQNELIEMVDKLRDLFLYKAKRAQRTVGAALCLQPLNLDGQVLIGYDKAEQLSGDRDALRIVNTTEELDFTVSPYILLTDGTIFFFDNQKEEKKTERQSYVTGKRKSEEEPFFTHLMQLNTSADREMAIDSSMRIQAEDELLNRLDLEPRFIKPEYLLQWLRGNLEEYESGVFLLKMPRGTGKSTFTEKLNRLYEGPELVDEDLDVRTYHISRSQMIRQNDFALHIEEQCIHDFDVKKEWMRPKRIKEYLAEGSKPSEALCLFLKECLRFTQYRRCKQQIMLVIDGLDEIEDSSLWQFIPSPEQLPEDVYLLLTTRDPETEALPEHTKQHLSALQVTEELRVDMHGQDNRRFLETYLDKYFSKEKKARKPGPEEIEAMERLAEYRVLNFSMLCKLVDAGVPVSELADAGNQLAQYLSILYESYGEKETRRLKELIAVLCSIGAEEPISVHEIAGLLNNGTVSLGLLGMLNDLEPLLHVQRGYMGNGRLYPGENRYEPANEDVAELLKKLVPEWQTNMADLLEETLARVQTAGKDNTVTQDKNDSDLLVLSHANACGWEALFAEATPDVSVLNSFFVVIPAFSITRFILTLERVSLVYGILAKTYESLDMQDRLPNRNSLAVTYSLLASVLIDLGRHEEALANYEKARAIREELDMQGRLLDKNDLAVTYDNLAGALREVRRYEDALVYEEKARAIYEDLDMQGRLPNRYDLGIFYSNLALVLQDLRRYEEALVYQEKTLAIREELDIQGRLLIRNDLANTYHNLAAVLHDLRRYEESLAYYEKARAIWEELDMQGRLLDKNDLAATYHSLAFVLQNLGQREESLAYYEKASAIREELDMQGRLLIRSDLADTYNNLASVLRDLRRHEEALAYYEKARAICEDLDMQGRLPDRNHLATAYNNLAFVLQDLRRYEEALAYYEKAKAIREELDMQGRLPDRINLASAYINLASVLQAMGQHKEALAYYEKARAIREELDMQGKLPDRNDLATTYNHLAFVLQDLRRHEDALSEYEKAKAIWEEMDANGERKNRNNLASVYNNMAWSMTRLDRHNDALVYYEKARIIREELDAQGLLSDQNDLATIYSNLAKTLEALGRNEEVLSYYEKARTIWEELDAQGKLTDRKGLAKTYHRIGEALDALGRGAEAAEMYQKEKDCCAQLE